MVDARGVPAPKRPAYPGCRPLAGCFSAKSHSHAKGRVGQHVVEGPLVAVGIAVKAVAGKAVAEDDVA